MSATIGTTTSTPARNCGTVADSQASDPAVDKSKKKQSGASGASDFDCGDHHRARQAAVGKLDEARGAAHASDTAKPEPIDVKQAGSVVFGQGNKKVSNEAIHAAIDEIIQKYPGDTKKQNDEMLRAAIGAGVSAQQVADLNRPGFTLSGINNYLASRGIRQQPATAPNQVEPYAKNLEPNEAKQISARYEEVFGYPPSPDALELYGYKKTGTYPQTVDKIVAGISKNSDYEGVKIDLRTALEGGIDPGIMKNLTGTVKDALDWDSILNADRPNDALREALHDQLNNKDAIPTHHLNTWAMGSNREVLAQSGNLAVVRQLGNNAMSLAIVDDGGSYVKINIPFTSEGIMEAAYTYGLNADSGYADSLNDLAAQLEQKGVQYKPGERYAGHGSNAGVNLRDIAKGGTGAGYVATWQHSQSHDAQVGSGSTGGRERFAEGAYIANRLGVDLSKASSVNAFIEQRTGGDGLKYGYAVKIGDSISWYKTAKEAQAYITSKNGRGELYNLTGGKQANLSIQRSPIQG